MPRFPLDSAFDELRREVEQTREALGAFRAALGGLDRAASSTVSSGGAAVAGGAKRDVQELVVSSREFLGILEGVNKTAKGAGEVAKLLGLERAGKELDALGSSVEKVTQLIRGIPAVVKGAIPVLAAMAPVVLPLVAALTAATVAQKKLNDAAGQSRGWIESLRQVGRNLLGLPIDAQRARLQQLFEQLDRLQRFRQEALAGGDEAGAENTLRLIEETTQAIEDQKVAIEGTKDAIADLGRLFDQAKNEADRLVNAVRVLDLISAGSFADARERLARAQLQLAQLARGDVEAQAAAIRAVEAETSAAIAKLREQLDVLRAEPVELFDPRSDQVQARIQLLVEEIELTRRLGEERVKALELQTPFGRFEAQLRQIGNLTQNTLDLAAQAVEAFAATASRAILDAFLDPQADIRESFGNLFRALAQQLLQVLIQALVVKALAGAGIGAASEGGVVGAAQGGVIGLADGGFPGLGRPPGIAASDTVPALLTPGEVVEPVPSVNYYGAPFFEALRRRIIPNTLTNALMQGINIPTPRVVPKVGYAGGGPVAPVLPAAAGAPAVLPVLVAGEDSLRIQLGQGSRAFERHMRDNRNRHPR